MKRHKTMSKLSAAVLAGVGIGTLGLLPPMAGGTAPAPVRICLEAEAGKLTPPVRLCTHPDCSGGQGIEVPAGANPEPKDGEPEPELAGDCTLTFKVPRTGVYRLYVRAWWSDGCGNSFAVSFDGGRAVIVSDGDYKRWHWVKGRPIHLTAGTHVLKIANSEDGARLDQVYLTTDATRVPVGKEKPTPGALVR